MFFTAAQQDKKILIWNLDNVDLLTVVEAVLVCQQFSETHLDTWSGNLDDYQLILFPAATADPPWWSSISGGNWVGRILITCDHNNQSQLLPSITYLNSKSSLTGVSITGAALDSGNGIGSTPETDDLTSGVANIFHAATSVTSGGVVLAKTVESAQSFNARNKSGETDWIVCGDSNVIIDRDSGGQQWGAQLNFNFLSNLFSVPV
jgi:hypothetical protein